MRNITVITFDLQFSGDFQKRTQIVLLYFDGTHVHVLAQTLHFVKSNTSHYHRRMFTRILLKDRLEVWAARRQDKLMRLKHRMSDTFVYRLKYAAKSHSQKAVLTSNRYIDKDLFVEQAFEQCS